MRIRTVLENLKKILRSDGFSPSAETFPNLDTMRLSEQLKPEAAGRKRGEKDQPRQEATSLDAQELEIVNAVERLRSLGVKLYQEHAAVYSDRLGSAAEAKNEIRIVAGQASGNFNDVCRLSESEMQGVVAKLKEAAEWKSDFRKRNRLRRPGIRLHSSGIRWAAIISAFVLGEAALNSYLFSQKNEFGLLGGILAALLISVANVGVASAAGYYSRFIWHVNLFAKLFGLLIILSWLAFVLTFNVGLAHFRDALVSLAGIDWNTATNQAIQEMRAGPLLIDSLESWLLVVIGFLFSLVACLKGFYADDPYPFFGKIERELDQHRQNYASEHRTTLTMLREERDEAVAMLHEANDEVKTAFSEAIDVLDGHSSLNSQFNEFLDRCNSVAQQLLQKYRDANIDVRSEPAPEYFNQVHRFPEISRRVLPEDRRLDAEKAREDIAEIVTETIRKITSEHDEAVGTFRTAKDIEDSAENTGHGIRADG